MGQGQFEGKKRWGGRVMMNQNGIRSCSINRQVVHAYYCGLVAYIGGNLIRKIKTIYIYIYNGQGEYSGKMQDLGEDEL